MITTSAIVPEWKCVSRPYAKAAPGIVTIATADCTNHFTLAAHTDQPGQVEIWFPDANTGTPEVHGDHITDIQTTAVPGGWNVTARPTATTPSSGPRTPQRHRRSRIRRRGRPDDLLST